ncbi:MAG: TadE/TadG family type IV pilus assembly protein, partial [Methylocella sp.]
MFSFFHKNCRCLPSSPRGFPFGLAARFMRDRSGAYAVMFGLMAPMFIGALALGSETGLWYATQEKMQGAADSAAISAAVGVIAGNTNWALQADATAASDGFVNGSSGTVVTVNNPPKSGPNTGIAGDIEVIITQPQKLLFSSLFLKSPVVIEARAVAGKTPGVVCVLALNGFLGVPVLPGIVDAALSNVLADQCNVADNSPSPLALTVAALANMTAQKVVVVGGYIDLLGTITTTQGIQTSAPATPDPYAGTPFPAFSGLTCDPNSASFLKIGGTVTLSPGRYCGGISVGVGANVTLNPGTYIMDGGTLGVGLNVAVGGSLTGTGVTIAQTGLVNLSLQLGGVINLTAPSSGPLAGLVLFVDPNSLISVLTFTGGTNVNLVGTIYAPSSQVVYTVGSGTKTGQCTRLIANTINF